MSMLERDMAKMAQQQISNAISFTFWRIISKVIWLFGAAMVFHYWISPDITLWISLIMKR